MASEWTTVSYKKQTPVKASPVQTLPYPTHNVVTMSTMPKVDVVRKPNTKNQSSINATHVERKADEGNYTLPTVSHELQTQIQQARNRKGMTQKQLAVACNLQESVIRSYEQGTCMPNSKEMSTMGRVLGVTLKNK